jgi:hypothetical protein
MDLIDYIMGLLEHKGYCQPDSLVTELEEFLGRDVMVRIIKKIKINDEPTRHVFALLVEFCPWFMEVSFYCFEYANSLCKQALKHPAIPKALV